MAKAKSNSPKMTAAGEKLYIAIGDDAGFWGISQGATAKEANEDFEATFVGTSKYILEVTLPKIVEPAYTVIKVTV